MTDINTYETMLSVTSLTLYLEYIYIHSLNYV